MTIGNNPPARTFILTARVDIRTYASVLRFYVERGIRPHSKNELLGLVLEDFAQILTAQFDMQRMQTDEAFAYIVNSFGVDLSSRTKKSILTKLRAETGAAPLVDPSLQTPALPQAQTQSSRMQEILGALDKEVE